MIVFWKLFYRLIWRQLLREPVRSGLMLFAVALGVAVVVAIDLSGDAAAGSFHSSLESLTGKADLELSTTGGLDEHLLGKLAQFPADFHFTPRIEDFASIDGDGEALPFLGLDLVASHLGDDSDSFKVNRLGDENVVWVGARLGLGTGQTVRLLINDESRTFKVAGVLKPKPTDLSEQNAIVADIGLAQRVTGKLGKIDRIEVTIPKGASLESSRSQLKALLPVSVAIEEQGARTEENRRMLASFRWNLQVLSYIALVVGGFLIYNTISVSVVRRRSEIGIIRALGASRTMLLSGFLAEACVFGLLGGAIGLFLGRFMAIGAVQLVGSTIQSLYVSSQPAPVEFTPSALLVGMFVGVAVSLLAAFAPALEASRVAPVEAMARGRQEYWTRVRSKPVLLLAVALTILAIVFSLLPPVGRRPVFGFASALLLIAATCALIPSSVLALVNLVHRAIERLFGIEALLALRSLRASLGRTSVLIGALATAVAMMVSVGIMVGSFRDTVSLWMDNQLRADFYLRPAGSSAADRHSTMSSELMVKLKSLPGVATVDGFRAYSISYQGMPASLGGSDFGEITSHSDIRFVRGQGDTSAFDLLAKGDYVMVSEPFANKHHVRLHDSIPLSLGGHQKAFKVLGIYYDYSTERGFVVMDRHRLQRYLPDPAVSNIAVFLKPNADANQVRHAIDRAIAGRGVLVFTNSRLRREALAIFDRTFTVTYALEAVAVFVAVMGMAGALLTLVIDRRREFGLLRFLGAASGQIRRVILFEAGLLGLLANGIGLALGAALSLILIFVINKQSFGWTIQFHLPVLLIFSALTGIYIATVVAGLYPARTAIRLNPIEVVHEE